MRKFKNKDGENTVNLSAIDLEREDECGICLEINSKVVLPNCTHALCFKCFLDWYVKKQPYDWGLFNC